MTARWGVALLAVAGVLVACGDSDEDGAAPAVEPTPTAAAPTTAAPTTPAPATAAPTTTVTTALVPTTSAELDGELFPDVLAAEATAQGDGTWRFSATLSSPYDTPDRYADAWRVTGPGGEVYGVRVLAHDHANEQPFTRSLDGVEIPDDVAEVTVEGRDQVSGWGGATVTVVLER